MIYLNNVSGASVGVIVEHRPARPIPRRQTLSWTVPGRSTPVVRELDAWEPIELSYEIAVAQVSPVPLSSTVDMAVAWLTQGGELQLYDDTDPNVFYRVRSRGGGSLAPILHRARRATVKFDADPRRYLLTGETPVTVEVGDSATLDNPTANTATPRILVHAASSDAAQPGSITVGGAVLSFADGRDLVIDCERRYASKTVTATDGVWPILPPGQTTVSLTGEGLSAEIFPRWFVL